MREETFEKTSEQLIDDVGPEWITRIPPQTREMLKGLLLRRAVALVHVLKPIEDHLRRLVSFTGLPPARLQWGNKYVPPARHILMGAVLLQQKTELEISNSHD